MNVDANVVIQNLSQRMAQLEIDLAVKGAYIQSLEKQIVGLKEESKA
ncbi:hypothetical protein ABES25_10000 [Bacillus gobiensis]